MNHYVQALIATGILATPTAFVVWLDSRLARSSSSQVRASRTAPRPDVSSSTSGRVERHRGVRRG